MFDHDSYTSVSAKNHAEVLSELNCKSYPQSLNTMVSNRFVYINQDHYAPKNQTKVLVNPHFNQKVFVNPHFAKCASLQIHVNPSPQKKIDHTGKNIHIHINPNKLNTLSSKILKIQQVDDPNRKTNDALKIPPLVAEKQRQPFQPNFKIVKNLNNVIAGKERQPLNSKFKIIKDLTMEKQRRILYTKFKIIKTEPISASVLTADNSKRKLSICSKYKIVKSSTTTPNSTIKQSDHQIQNKSFIRNRKYVYINRFLNISDLARTNLLKQKRKSGLINISGIMYKKSPNSLKRTASLTFKDIRGKRERDNLMCKTKYKLVRKKVEKKVFKSKILRKQTIATPGKLKKCNIPCPFYTKHGRCKLKELGRCSRKHDPHQVALCTKFLQGACVNKKCLLSHNVSSEKMPTCKFYLEGSCSRDDCPYLHVRISPKAEICRDFLEGFCKKATQCNKRHQFLCADYEKSGSCLRQRCPYPHGNMVRKYLVIKQTKIAKKSSVQKKISETKVCESISDVATALCADKNNLPEIKSRYYDSEKVQKEKSPNLSEETNLRSRPKLGILPSFIAFN